MKKLLTISAALLAALAVSGCNDQAVASSTAAAPPAKPAHVYAIKDGLEYGYEVGLSENDKKAGQVAAKIAMYRYLGRKDDTYQVMLRDGEVRMVFECAKPCTFGKVHTFVGNRYMGKEVLKLSPEAILTGVMRDAMSGELDQNVGKQNDKAVTYWVDGEGKRLIVADATTSGVVR